MKKTALMATIVLASCAAWLLASEPQRSPASGVLIIKDAFILPVSRPALPKGSVLIREGKIAEIGPQVATPEGATVIDAKGQYVMPGIIDCHSHIAISGGVNEGTLAVTAMVGIEDVIRDALIEARTYTEKWDEYKKRALAADKPAIPPAKDLKLETLAEILRGERLVHAHCYRADEILMLLRVADEFGFKIATFQHVLEGYKVAKEIAEHGAGASTFSDWWAYKVEAYDAIPYNAAIMTRKGVVVSINSDSAEEARHLNQEAAKCMKYGGLSEQEALALITLNPAKQLRIDNRVGSIEPGKDADLVIYNRHPLSVYAVAQKVFIDGQVYFDIQKDLEMRERLEKERASLKERDKKEGERERPEGRRTPPTNITTTAVEPQDRH